MIDEREPYWIDVVALEILARACLVELTVPVHLPVELRPLPLTPSIRRGARDAGLRRLQRVGVPVRDVSALETIVETPRAAWRAGERTPTVLARMLYDGLAGMPGIRGAREVLATSAVLLFLSTNGWLAEGPPAWFTHQLRELLRGRRAATRARALANLTRSVQRPAGANS